MRSSFNARSRVVRLLQLCLATWRDAGKLGFGSVWEFSRNSDVGRQVPAVLRCGFRYYPSPTQRLRHDKGRPRPQSSTPVKILEIGSSCRLYYDTGAGERAKVRAGGAPIRL